MCPSIWPERGLRWLAYSFDGIECQGHMYSTLLLVLDLQKWQLGVFFVCFFLFVSSVHNLPQLSMHTVVFSVLFVAV